MRIGLMTILFLIFLVLKLTGNIDWNWIWVLSPLWFSFAFWFVILFIIAMANTSFGKHKGWR